MITSNVLSNYKELQENNCHGELLSVISSDLGLSNYKQVFDSINTIHDIEGHLSYDLLQVRERFRYDLKVYIVDYFNIEESEAILQYV